MEKLIESVITLRPSEMLEFCGEGDRNLALIRDKFAVRLVARGNNIKIIGDPEEVRRAEDFIREMLEVHRTQARRGAKTTPIQWKAAVGSAAPDKKNGEANNHSLQGLFLDHISVPLRHRTISPLTPGQKQYVEAIRRNDIVFGIGPAGTGKTYLAVAMAVQALARGETGRIILVRPAVEAGEKLGFLPGDIAAKFDPYVRPLWDALYEMIEPAKIRQYVETGIIEIAPLAFMRGRTLNNAFVILDEAQNTSEEQMKMFLTRLGFDSKAVVTGDVTQIDLPAKERSGLIHVQHVLKGIEGIAFVRFDDRDVVRHELVQQIIVAYERDQSAAAGGGNGGQRRSSPPSASPQTDPATDRQS
ncbi:MAG: PhoH family protein [Candidatus Sumerlaeia bacterium]